ncbi:MAG: DUF2817 domain-containing protein [Deltaproteobacteria bacterium]|nr:DUF2817 domain-containing protein [Deltaproteobacteria bacterium]
MKESIIGYSVKKKPLVSYECGEGSHHVHIYGGIHGDEPESVDVLERLIKFLRKYPKFLKLSKHYIIVPKLNPDGLEAQTRVNASKVDLNRNFPSRYWSAHYELEKNYPGPKSASEPEVEAIVKLIEKYPPGVILSVHSWIPQVNFDGPAEDLARVLSENNGYPVTSHIGYATPG